MIEYLYGSRKFVVDMNVSACFESQGECEITIPVLRKTILPKVNCDWYNGFSNEGKHVKFDFQSFYFNLLKTEE
jgi:hypothetical protein